MERQHSRRLTRWQNAYSPNNIVLESLLACKREGIARVPPFSRNNCLHEILSLLLIRNNNYTQRNSYIHLTDFSTKKCFEIESIVSFLSFFFFFFEIDEDIPTVFDVVQQVHWYRVLTRALTDTPVKTRASLANFE